MAQSADATERSLALRWDVDPVRVNPKAGACSSPASAAQLVAMPVHLGLPILGIPLVHHGAVVEAQKLRSPGVWQQEPHHLLISRKYLQDHTSNRLATGYAEIAQNSFADAL